MNHALKFSLAALVAALAPLGAQQDTLVSLRGRVRASTDSAPLMDAAIRLPDLSRQLVSGADGRFTFERVPRGHWRVEIRRHDFAPLDTILDVVHADSQIDLVLRPVAQQLQPITVSAPGSDGPGSASLPEFEARRMRGVGRYITAAELRAADNRTVPDVLRAHMTGLALEWSSSGIRAYNPNQQPPGALRGKSDRKCYVQVVVDGAAIYQQGNGTEVSEPPNLNEYATRELDGIEYYSNPARTPPEFRTNGALCGTLVLWSRRR